MRIPSDSRPATLSLTVASPDERPVEEAEGRVPWVPWLVVAAVWAGITFALGWAMLAGFVSIGWLTAAHIAPAEVAGTVAQAWMALHGAPARLGDATVALPPLGLTLLLVVGLAVVAHHAAQHHPLDPEVGSRRRARAWAGVTAASAATYLALAGIAAAMVGTPSQANAVLVGSLLISVPGAGAGAAIGLGVTPLAAGPGWLRRLPRALVLGVTVLSIGALAALVTALVMHWPQVVARHEALAPDAVGSVLLVLLQAAWWPTWLLWAGSFVLGAGVHIGPETLVAPGVAKAGVLPPVPVFGAVPVVPGAADWAWLAFGLTAGALAGWWVVRDPEPSGSPQWGVALWQGGIGGMAPGVVWVTASWFATGDLGVQRLVGIGPRFPELLVWGTLPLAAAGALTGLGWALARFRRRRPARRDARSR